MESEMEKVRVLNIDILNVTQTQLLEQLHKGVLFTPNVDHLCQLQKDKDFYEAYKHADWIICDSQILRLFTKLLRKPLVESIPGATFFTAFYNYHQDDPNCKIFILGGKKGVADKAMRNINQSIGRDIIVGAHSPSFHIDDNEIKDIALIIKKSGATMVLTGLGAPKQEKIIFKLKELVPTVNIWMALGATVDFEAGTQKRAPMLVQKLALEWLYRFVREPKRLFKRYFVNDIHFFGYFAKQLAGVYKNPFEL